MKFTPKQAEQRKKLHTDVTENWPHHRGKNELLKFLDSFEITRAESMIAMCFQCTGGFEGGSWDCLSVTCPLYVYIPYRATKKAKPVSEEKRLVLVEHLKKARNKKHE